MRRRSGLPGSSALRSVRELNIIMKISRHIISTLNYEKVLQIISDGMAELFGIESSAIYIIENNDGLMLGATTPPLDPGMPVSLRKASISDHPHIREALENRRAVTLPDTGKATLSPAERAVVEMRHLRSLLYLPFVQEETVLGVLILGTCEKQRAFSKKETDLGQIVANQLAVAIQNSRLHEDIKTHKENLEKLVERRTSELKEANNELQRMYSELLEKNELVMQQKEEIETNLNYIKSVQMKLIQSEKMASLGVLTAGVAHEINNPLNFIMGSCTGLEDFFNNTAPEHLEDVMMYLNGIRAGVERVSFIVHGLNQFSRDNRTYDEQCDIHAILDNCMVMLYNKYKFRIEIEKQYTSENMIVKGNVGKLHQVFTNIIVNSIQAIDDSGKITIETRNDGSYGHVRISDTGKGISREILSKITEPFFTTKSPNEGTGLGLSITDTIIREHNGLLEFESEAGKGTTVKISLPNIIRQ